MPWYLRLALSLPSVIGDIRDAIEEHAGPDGVVSPAEAETIGRALSESMGDVLRVKVRGTDIVGPNAQADLFAFVARVAANASNA